MSSRIFNNILSQTVRKNCSLLLIQNVNNSTCAHHRVKFYKINENRHSNLFCINKIPPHKTLCHTPVMFNMSFHRNLSVDTKKEPEKQPDSATPNSSTDNTDLSSFDSDFSLVDDISNSDLIKFATDLLIELHKETGLPWWATVAATAFAVRTAFLPMAVTQVRLTLKLQAVSLELEEIKNKLKVEINQARQKFGWPKSILDEKFDEAVQKESDILVVREKCHPVKTCVLIFLQVPTWFIFTFATRKLCMPSETGDSTHEAYTELLTENFGWISSLASADQLFILPVTIALINLAIVQVHQMNVVDRRIKTEQWKTLLSRGLSLSLIPIAASLPAATNIYWLSSSLFGLLQASILYSKPSRRLFKMPLLSKEKN